MVRQTQYIASRIGPALSIGALAGLLILACGGPDATTTGLSGTASETAPATAAPRPPTPAPEPTQGPGPSLTPAAREAVSPTPAPAGTPIPMWGPTPVGPPMSPPAASQAINETDFPLTLPAGFRISLFTPERVGPLRFMAFSPDGILFVAMPSASGLYSHWRGGAVFALPDRDQDGAADEVIAVIEDRRDSPHGLAFYGGYLYLAEHGAVTRYPYLGDGVLGETPELVTGLPFGRGHLSRTVGFSPSGKMYVSIGSSCNVCREADQRRAAVMEYNPDGSGARVFAEGLRNSVGLVFHPGTGEIWATENGRDNLGDDLPPDEVNIVRSGLNYGWPYCYGKKVPDLEFEDSDRCAATQESVHDLQAHSAPLGLRFIESAQFPEEWQGDLLVAYHGSWNRSIPTGYKVVRLDVEGSEVVGEEDFIAGWLLEDGSSVGRPVDLIFGPENGALYISDDKAGVIYRVTGDR